MIFGNLIRNKHYKPDVSFVSKNGRGRNEHLFVKTLTLSEMFLLGFNNIGKFWEVIEKEKGFIKGFLINKVRYYQADTGRYKLITRKLIRNPPKTMKIDSPQFRSCISDEVIILNNLFTTHGHEIRIVGGAVRDILLGIQPLDLDFSTTASPAEMKQMFEENKFRLINMKGEKHGTITTRINDKNFEVTTLRVDLATDGRHAEVEFTKEWVLDANRRDLTINAMYLGLDGTLYDYFNGYEDLKNKRLIFVGDAALRIREDYLRILRYFRFYGKIAETPDNHDEDVLKAIKENSKGLEFVSGERIWIELCKIFQGAFAGEVILKMLSLGIGPYIGIPRKYNEGEFKRIWDKLKMKDVKAKPITFLSALFDNINDLNDFYARLKLSNVDRDVGYFILNHRKETEESDCLRRYQILMVDSKCNKDAIYEFLKYQGRLDFLEELRNWQIPKLPVDGHVLKKMGMKGKEIGDVTNYLKKIWYEHDFNISAEELLSFIPKRKKLS